MALDIYEYDVENNVYIKHSKDGLLTNPVQSTHDGTNGEVVEKILYLKNDDSNVYYSNLTLQALPLTKTGVGDLNYPEAFISFKIIAQNSQPTANEWASVNSGNKIAFPDIGESGLGDTGYKSFWVQVSIPGGTVVQNISDVYIRLEGEENTV